ncbi:MAG: alkaline phosphatase [Acidobacteria bacterium]|nr:MAG: alkaline phosphatase [Acidobacteriota bacterium]
MDRRNFLTLAAAAIAAARQDRAPAIITRDGERPGVPCGVATGDVTAGQAIVWSRSDRPARLIVEYSTTPSFANTRRVVGPSALEDTDFTARVNLTGLPAGQRISYRVLFQDLTDLRRFSVPVGGAFQTPAAARTPGGSGARDVTFAFSGDCVGQGWGIDPARGGIRLYDAMRRAQPDVFIHLGDTIYADQPLESEVVLDEGSIWRNVVTEAKSRVAQTLDDYRGCHRYNLQDEHMRRFNADVSQVALWDDHEVRDNWYPTERLESDPRYHVKSVALLAARAKRAFLEYLPLRINPIESERIYRAWRHGPMLEIFALDMRSYRGANSTNRQAALTEESAILGAAQAAWLERALAASTSTWKVIASDLPLGLVVPDAGGAFEAVANKDDGPPLGRELEIARVLKFIRDRHVRNVVWLTADVHYCAAHHYSPARARFTEFDPFWEFVAGPLHAGTFGPNEMDRTFGPEVKFLGIPPGLKPNRPPSEPFQFFGSGRIDHRTRTLTMKLHNVNSEIFSIELPPVE